jgi:hypothetical protein
MGVHVTESPWPPAERSGAEQPAARARLAGPPSSLPCSPGVSNPTALMAARRSRSRPCQCTRDQDPPGQALCVPLAGG